MIRFVTIIFLSMVIGLTLAPNAIAQINSYHSEFVELNNSEIQKNIRVIKQDDAGMIWVGTEDGLYRFNGIEFKKIIVSDARSVVNDIWVDKNGRLWVSWLGFPTSVYNPNLNQWHFFDIDSKELSTLISLNENKAFFNSGLGQNTFYIVNNKLELTKLNELADLNTIDLRNITVYKDKLILEKVYKIVTYDLINKHHTDISFELADEYYLGSVAHHNEFYLCTNKALYLLVDNSLKLIHKKLLGISVKTFPNICKIMDDKIFYSIGPKGFEYFDLLKNKPGEVVSNYFDDLNSNILPIYSYSNKDSFILATSEKIWLVKNDVVNLINIDINYDIGHKSPIIITNDNNIIVGTDGNGLVKISENIKIFMTTVPPFPQNHHVRKMVEYDDKLWFGAMSHGIISWDRNLSKWELYDLMTFNKPLTRILAKDNLNQLWVGSSQGDIFKYNKEHNNFERIVKGSKFQSGIGAMMYFNNYIWYETGSILYKLHVVTHEIEEVPLNLKSQYGFFVRSLSVTKSGLILLGTHGNGLLIINEAGQIIKNLNDAKLSSFIFSSIEDSDNIIWIGTWGGGLVRYSLIDDKYQIINSTNFKINDTVFGIVEDREDIWVSTYEGIYKIENCGYSDWPCSPSITNYTNLDGLQSKEFDADGYGKLNSGEIYFSGVDGFNLFNPETLIKNNQPPKIALYTLKTNDNKFLDINTDINLPYDYQKLTLEFSGVSLSNPESNRYKYKLNDAKWQPLSGPKLSISEFKSGTNTILYNASNNHQVFSEEPVSLSIKVLKPWYFSNLAIFLYVFCLIILFFIFDYIKNISLKRANTKLEDKVSRRTTIINTQKIALEESYKSLNMLYAKISHEIRTPLTIMQGPIEKMKQSSKHDSKSIHIIERQIEILKDFINNLVNLSSLNSVKNIQFGAHQIKPYLYTLVDDINHLAKNKNITVILEILTENDACVRSYKRSLNIVLSNLAINAIKQAPNGGKMLIKTFSKESNIHILVEDNGPGIPESEINTIFEYGKTNNNSSNWINSLGIGLSLSKEIVLTLGGELQVGSSTFGGAKFELILPIVAKNSLPAIQDHFNTLNIQHTDVTPAQQLYIDTKKQNILILDDQIEILDLIGEYLSPFYNIIKCVDATSTLDYIKNNEVDLLICDIMLPDFNGFDLIEMIKSDITSDDLIIVVLSAMDDYSTKIKSLEYKADYHLSKPFNIKELLLVLNNLLTKKSAIKQQVIFNFLSNESNNTEQSKVKKTTIEKVLNVIELNYSNKDFKGPEIAKTIGMSLSTLQRKIKEESDYTLGELFYGFRINKAKQMLLKDFAITEIAFSCGFSSQSHFNVKFKKITALTPSEFRQKNIKG